MAAEKSLGEGGRREEGQKGRSVIAKQTPQTQLEADLREQSTCNRSMAQEEASCNGSILTLFVSMPRGFHSRWSVLRERFRGVYHQGVEQLSQLRVHDCLAEERLSAFGLHRDGLSIVDECLIKKR